MSKEYNSYQHKSLSIQLSSDGFSFCVYNNTSNLYEYLSNTTFSAKVLNPKDLLEEVKKVFENEETLHKSYSEINLIHHNNLNTFVPVAHFQEDLLHDYLKNTVKTFKNDFVSYDELEHLKANNVYIPFVNINNFVFDSFGEFTYLHSSTVFLQNVLKRFSIAERTMFVNVYQGDFQILILENNELILSNHFNYATKEDFVYYILFVAEQLKMNPNEFKLYLFGTIKENSEEYSLLFNYVRNVEIYETKNANLTDSIEVLPQENFNLLQLHI